LRLARADQVLGFQLHSPSHRVPDGLVRAVAAAKRERGKAPS
jgi:hypothetical protein